MHVHTCARVSVCVHARDFRSSKLFLALRLCGKRKLKRIFQEQDKVQVELTTEHGQWLDGVVVKRGYETCTVQFPGGRRDVSMHVSEEKTCEGVELTGEAHVKSMPRPSIDVVPARLRWRSPALDRAKALLHRIKLANFPGSTP